MGKRNWARGKALWKALILVAGVLFPSVGWAAQADAVYLDPLQDRISSVVSSASGVGAIDAWLATETLKTAPRQMAAVIPTTPRRQTASPSSASAVFQSVAFRVSSIPAAQKWKAVVPEIAAANLKDCRGASECVAKKILGASIDGSVRSSFQQKLNSVNRTVNKLVRYQSDAENYGSKDHWASPSEILIRGKGDCEDYAILKMATLKEAGLPPQAMSIVVLRDTRRNLYHAVLSVMTSQGYFILDNLSDEVKLDIALPNYLPLYSVSAERTWIHGIKARGSKIAAAAAPSLDVMPGEGELQ